MKTILIIFVSLNIMVVFCMKYFIDSTTWQYIKEFFYSRRIKEYFKIIFWSYVLYNILEKIFFEMYSPSWYDIFLIGISFIIFWEYIRKKSNKIKEDNIFNDVMILVFATTFTVLSFYVYLPSLIETMIDTIEFFTGNNSFFPSFEIFTWLFILSLYFSIMYSSYKNAYILWKEDKNQNK